MKKRNWYWEMEKSLKLFKSKKEIDKKTIKDLPTEDLKVILLAIAKLYAKIRDGNVCVTCGAKYLSGKNWHGGHFIRDSVGGVLLRYDEDNIHSQCFRCNMTLQGNEGEYYRYMLDRYGKRKVDNMFHLKHNKTEKWYKVDYLKKINYYIKKFKKYEQTGS